MPVVAAFNRRLSRLAIVGAVIVFSLVADKTFAQAAPGDVIVSITGTGTVSWRAPTENVDGSVLTDLAGFKIYAGRQSRQYDIEIEVGLSDATSGTIAIPIIDESDVTWFFAMTALDTPVVDPTTGQLLPANESAFSNEVIKTLTVTFSDSRVPNAPVLERVDLNLNCSTDSVLVTCEITVQ